MNPYETVYNSPTNHAFMDKSTTVGGENRNSMLTTAGGGGTEIKILRDK
jgi:hypothetical protein